MLDLNRQYQPLHQELLEAVGHVLETQQFILGEQVAAFERSAAHELGVAHALGCSSGTDALWLALAAGGLGPGLAGLLPPRPPSPARPQRSKPFSRVRGASPPAPSCPSTFTASAPIGPRLPAK